jgi:LMBR1 domain-containing protein 1
MTNLSSFYNKYNDFEIISRMSVGYPLFAICFFISNIAFLVSSLLCLIYQAFKAKVSQIDVQEDPEYDEETS